MNAEAQPRLITIPSGLPPYDDERTTPPAVPVDLAPVLPLVFIARPAMEEFPVPCTVRPLPPPGQAVAAAVMAVLEVQAGRRPLKHLQAIASVHVMARLERRTRLAAIPNPRPSAPARLTRLRITRPSDRITEVAAVITRGERVSALALRMDWTGRRWIMTALEGI